MRQTYWFGNVIEYMSRRNSYTAVVLGAILVIFAIGIITVAFDYEEMPSSVQDKTEPNKWEKYMSEEISFRNYLPPLR